ncbi:MAG: endonuclease MutS2 [Acidobacteriia bacterium]|nr:endonuclease MutS2 [Terriglobia bacterium]
MNPSSLHTLEYHELLAVLSRYLTSGLARERSPLLQVQPQMADLRRELRCTTELKQLLSEGHRFNFSELSSISEIFSHLAIQGSVLEPLEILEMEKLLQAFRRTRASGRAVQEKYPGIGRMAEQLPELQMLEKQLKGKVLPTGELANEASPALDSIRKSIRRVNEKIQHTLSKLVQKGSGSPAVQDEFVTLRNDRFVIPVRVEQRKNIPGVFHGSSSSGATVYVEPLSVVELNNDLASRREAERKEVQRILASLSDQLRAVLPEMQAGADVLVELDITQAKADFSRDFNCCEPELNTEGTLGLDQARHPLLEDTLRRRGKTTVPVSIDLNRGRNLLVISGPNTGGKTVALKTVGLLALMAQSGMHIPAERATLPLFNNILADIGDRQSIQESLSTFASHVTNLCAMAAEVSSSDLVLIDEIGTGTDPAEGEALAVSTADFFRKSGAFTVITTHFSGLKIYASQTEGAVNSSMEFDEKTLKPTFRLIGGVAGASSGIEIAARLGLPHEITAEARRRLSAGHSSMIDFLNQLREEKKQYESGQVQLREEIDRSRADRQNAQLDFSRRWEQKARELESRFESFLGQVELHAKNVVEKIGDEKSRAQARREMDQEIKRLKERHRTQLKALVSETVPPAEEASVEEDSSNHVFRVGEKVFVRSFRKEGLLHKIDPAGTADVLIGSFKAKVPLAECRPLKPTASAAAPSSRAERSKADPHVIVETTAAESTEINLVGYTAEEALHTADKFLDQAFLANAPKVRIIHGSGMGVLRRSLADLFSKHPQVQKFYPAPPDQGGNGVTIVELKL